MSTRSDGAVTAEMAVEEKPAAETKGMDVTMSSLKQSMAKAAASTQPTPIRVQESMGKAMDAAQEIMAFSQGNIDAVMKSGQTWVAGMQDLSKEIAATAQASLDQSLSLFRSMADVRSLKDAIELQTSMARSAVERTMTDSRRLTSASINVAEQTMAPINARVTMAMERFAKSA